MLLGVVLIARGVGVRAALAALICSALAVRTRLIRGDIDLCIACIAKDIGRLCGLICLAI